MWKRSLARAMSQMVAMPEAKKDLRSRVGVENVFETLAIGAQEYRNRLGMSWWAVELKLKTLKTLTTGGTGFHRGKSARSTRSCAGAIAMWNNPSHPNEGNVPS